MSDKTSSSLSHADKAQLKNVLLDALLAELSQTRIAADEAKSSATSVEAKSENKYDTRSTEAAYLAHGHSLRAQSLLELIAQISAWQPTRDRFVTEGIFVDQKTPDPIAQRSAEKPIDHLSVQLGSLVELSRIDDPASARWIWITPAGARAIELAGITVQVVNLSAPLAQKLLGLEPCDTAQVLGAEWLINQVI